MIRPYNFDLNYNHHLSNKLIFAGLCNSPGTKLYYNSVAGKNHGTLNGGSYIFADKLNRFGYFANLSSYISSTFLDSITTQNFTLSAFVYPTSLNTWDGIFSFGTYAPGFYLYDGGGYVGVYYGASTLTSNYALSIKNWYHIVFRRTGTTLNFFINGQLLPTSQTLSTPSAWGSPFYIGFDSLPAESMDGYVVDPMFWLRDLSDGEIKTLADPSDVMINGLVKEPKRQYFVGTSFSASAGTANDDCTLYMYGANPSLTCPLYISGPILGEENDTVDLFTYASPAGTGILYGSTTLYTSSIDNFQTLPLYISAPAGFYSDSTNLYVHADPVPFNSVDLYTSGPGIVDDYVELYTTGLGTTADATPYSQNMPLYMARDFESTASNISLFMAQYNDINSMDISMFGSMLVENLIYRDNTVLDYIIDHDGSFTSTGETLKDAISDNVPSGFSGLSYVAKPGRSVRTNINRFTENPATDFNTYFPRIGLNDISLCGWFKIDQTSSVARVLFGPRNLTGGTGSFTIQLQNNILFSNLYYNGSSYFGASGDASSLQDNNWHHIAVVADRDSALRMYIDSTLCPHSSDMSSQASLDIYNFRNTNFSIGVNGSVPSFSGVLYDLRMYHYALSPSEISNIKSGQKINTDAIVNWFPNQSHGMPMYIYGSGLPPNALLDLYTHGF
jgi:hypothetical protein